MIWLFVFCLVSEMTWGVYWLFFFFAICPDSFSALPVLCPDPDGLHNPGYLTTSFPTSNGGPWEKPGGQEETDIVIFFPCFLLLWATSVVLAGSIQEATPKEGPISKPQTLLRY